jgi:DNA-binding response OmpR family regulator
MLAAEYLQEAGFTVDTASSATEAMNKLSLVPGGVDAVVLDMGLPDRSGDILFSEMRHLRSSLPIVLATGKDVQELRERFRGKDRIAFVRKPYVARDLLDALGSVGMRTTAGPPTDETNS